MSLGSILVELLLLTIAAALIALLISELCNEP